MRLPSSRSAFFRKADVQSRRIGVCGFAGAAMFPLSSRGCEPDNAPLGYTLFCFAPRETAKAHPPGFVDARCHVRRPPARGNMRRNTGDFEDSQGLARLRRAGLRPVLKTDTRRSRLCARIASTRCLLKFFLEQRDASSQPRLILKSHALPAARAPDAPLANKTHLQCLGNNFLGR